MIDISNILGFISSNPIFLSFIGSVIFGDAFILSMAFLSGSGYIPFTIVYFFSILGFIVADTFWYLIAKTKKVNYLLKIISKNKHSKTAEKYIQRSTYGKPFLALTYSKFIYGTRIITIFYIRKKIKFLKFLLYNSFLNFLLVSALVISGFLAGKGVTKFVDIFNGVRSIFFTLILSIIIITLLKNIIEYFIRKK